MNPSEEDKKHWVACSSVKSYCPVFKGDTKIVGMYTALEMHVKLHYSQELASMLGKALLVEPSEEMDDSSFSSKPWETENWWHYLLHRMFWLDGGRAFGSGFRKLMVAHEECRDAKHEGHYGERCERSYLYLDSRS